MQVEKVRLTSVTVAVQTEQLRERAHQNRESRAPTTCRHVCFPSRNLFRAGFLISWQFRNPTPRDIRVCEAP